MTAESFADDLRRIGLRSLLAAEAMVAVYAVMFAAAGYWAWMFASGDLFLERTTVPVVLGVAVVLWFAANAAFVYGATTDASWFHAAKAIVDAADGVEEAE